MLALLIAHALCIDTPIKREISQIEHAIEATPTSELYYHLALAHLKDQELERAFTAFLKALDLTSAQESWQLPQEPLNAYLKGENLLTYSGSDLATNFLVSIAYANQGEFGRFFEDFFVAYPHFKGTFLDFKTRGILYLRLSKRATEKKELYRNEAEYWLTKALDLNPEDPSLYRSLIVLAKDAKKGEDVLSYLEKLSLSGAHLARTDIYFYVEEALACGRREIAQRLLERAKEIYSYSRSIEAAEELLRRE